jgi:HTH-type transcriptional regulator / antitoxin HipB
MDAKEIGKRIRQERKILGMTQERLARLADCSKPTIIAMEQGKPTLRLDNLLSVVKALGLRLEVQGGVRGA